MSNKILEPFDESDNECNRFEMNTDRAVILDVADYQINIRVDPDTGDVIVRVGIRDDEEPEDPRYVVQLDYTNNGQAYYEGRP